MAGQKYDIVFVGAGPGGYVGAIRARQLGLKTLVVEKDKVGGVCLNIGCIPSKALIDKATKFRYLEELERFGVRVDRSAFDYSAVQEASRAAADTLSKGVQGLLKKNGVEFIGGAARFSEGRQLVVELPDGARREIDAEAFVIATGSRPRVVPGFEFDERRILSSTGALMLKELPKSLTILGAGAIGMEFAYVMNSFGVEVAVVEMMDRILPMEDPDAAVAAKSAFERRGVRFLTSTKAFSVDSSRAGSLSLSVGPSASSSPSEVLESESLLVAIGRKPNSEHLGLEELGVRLDRGYVVVGDWYETAAANVYAIGDVVAGEPQLAHVAYAQGEIVAERVAATLGKGDPPRRRRVDARFIPSAVYCEPQIAGFGLKEESLKADGRQYKAARFPYRGAGKSVAIGAPEGFVKILGDPLTGEIFGASAVGAEATELIHEILVSAQAELTVEDISTTMHAHPTLSESVKEAALSVLGRALHA